MTGRKKRAFSIWAFLTILLAFIIIKPWCNSDKIEYEKLEKYYKNNKALHANISDSLIAFCKENQTEVKLKKENAGEFKFSFHILVDFDNTFYPVYFDSALNRVDPKPEKTAKHRIPFTLIRSFKTSIYPAIAADSTETFFASTWYVKFRPGTQADFQYGIMVSADSIAPADCDRKISFNVCVAKSNAY